MSRSPAVGLLISEAEDSGTTSQISLGETKLPFSVRVFNSSQEHLTISLPEKPKNFLPATYRTGRDHISIPSYDDLDFLQRELLVPRLDSIRKHLWLVGRPMPPRPLHYQLVLSREIVITESMELHLVWAGSRIFIKPIPAYLLDADFWSNHLLGNDKEQGQSPDESQRQLREDIAKSARGFLFTYTALIAYESDYRIAQDRGLLPSSVTWDKWREFTRQFLQNHHYSSLNPRFWYGELRLSRLNSIYRWRKGLLWRGYSKVASHISYKDLLSDNFALLAAILGYVVIVLTAMQVGLATERLQTNMPFQDVSYGIAVLAIVAPLALGVAIFAIVLFIVVYNWIVTGAYEKRRFREMGLLPDWGGREAERGRAKTR
ncbi:hypothetical protein ABW19_dt0201455 [Dactylella cylindrospora]|nr:hypothetical protein ABW19_dt0201455 [Dactylella cylindrospora]